MSFVLGIRYKKVIKECETSSDEHRGNIYIKQTSDTQISSHLIVTLELAFMCIAILKTYKTLNENATLGMFLSFFASRCLYSQYLGGMRLMQTNSNFNVENTFALIHTSKNLHNISILCVLLHAL